MRGGCAAKARRENPGACLSVRASRGDHTGKQVCPPDVSMIHRWRVCDNMKTEISKGLYKKIFVASSLKMYSVFATFSPRRGAGARGDDVLRPPILHILKPAPFVYTFLSLDDMSLWRNDRRSAVRDKR